MKKKIFGGLLVVTIAAVAAFNVNISMNSVNKNLSTLTLANLEALANEPGTGGVEYHLGTGGTNWKTYSIQCTVAQSNSSGTNWYFNVEAGAYVYGIPVGVGLGGGSSSSTNTHYSPMTFYKDVCGKGGGLCLDPAPSGHPCA